MINSNIELSNDSCVLVQYLLKVPVHQIPGISQVLIWRETIGL